MKTCPFCAEVDLQDAATVCKHCGKDITEAEKPYYQRNIGCAPVLGSLLIIVGVAAAFYFFTAFDTSVEVPKQELLGQSFGGMRVNNLGLMQDRQNGILMGIGSAVFGLILVLAGMVRRR